MQDEKKLVWRYTVVESCQSSCNRASKSHTHTVNANVPPTERASDHLPNSHAHCEKESHANVHQKALSLFYIIEVCNLHRGHPCNMSDNTPVQPKEAPTPPVQADVEAPAPVPAPVQAEGGVHAEEAGAEVVQAEEAATDQRPTKLRRQEAFKKGEGHLQLGGTSTMKRQDAFNLTTKVGVVAATQVRVAHQVTFKDWLPPPTAPPASESSDAPPTSASSDAPPTSESSDAPPASTRPNPKSKWEASGHAK